MLSLRDRELKVRERYAVTQIKRRRDELDGPRGPGPLEVGSLSFPQAQSKVVFPSIFPLLLENRRPGHTSSGSRFCSEGNFVNAFTSCNISPSSRCCPLSNSSVKPPQRLAAMTLVYGPIELRRNRIQKAGSITPRSCTTDRLRRTISMIPSRDRCARGTATLDIDT